MKSFKLKEFFNPVVFIIAFSIGMLIVYITQPNKKIIIKYPSPNNINNLIYKFYNKDGCYKYDAEIVDCPNDMKNISITKNDEENDNNLFEQIKNIIN